jgi:hypothetical protein
MSEKRKLPTLAELYSGNIEQAQRMEQFDMLLNSSPRQEWIKTHPFIAGYQYLPIEKVEYLLKSIFKAWKIEITGNGESFNGVWVTVRVHYFHPITEEWMFHDGIGASQLQTKKGTSPADLININNGALTMAYPVAKSIAIKDACDHFGALFGANLNRKEVSAYKGNDSLLDAELPKNPEMTMDYAQSMIDKWRSLPYQTVIAKQKQRWAITPEIEIYMAGELS